jgi:GNAT superfamily N-acetyltransferase
MMSGGLRRAHPCPNVSKVINTRTATDAELQAWQCDWRTRLLAWYAHPDVPPGWVATQADARLAGFSPAHGAALEALTAAGELIGLMALSAMEQGGQHSAFLHDLWIRPEFRGRGYGRMALRRAEEWARSRGAGVLWLVTDPAEAAHAALFRAYPVRALQMIKKLDGQGVLADGLEGRPMTAAEYPGWRAQGERGYAADVAESGSMTAEQAAASSAEQFGRLLPDGLDTADQSILCLCADGESVATNWIAHHRAPGMSWVYAVEVHEGYRGKGYGRAAMVIGERATLDAGDTHLALNVFGQNQVAISLYTSMGYRAYDVGRSIEL